MSQHGDENTPDFWYQPCSRWELWDETFTRRLPVSEYPALKLIQARTSFAEKKYGFRDPENNTRVRLDLSGYCLYEKSSGASLGGVVWRRDVSVYEHVTAQQNQEIEGDFKSWLDYMPSISWQASAEWNLQYFSGRWYTFTGLAKGQEDHLSMWAKVVHSEDKDRLWHHWQESRNTGQDLRVEG